MDLPLDPLLHVEFDLHPLGSKADQRIRATLLPVQVTYDAVSFIVAYLRLYVV